MFNTCSPQHARSVVLRAAPIDAWAEALVAARPYPDLDAVIDRADQLAARWSDHDLAALRTATVATTIRPTRRWFAAPVDQADPEDEVSESLLLRCRLRELALLRLQQLLDDRAAVARSTEVGRARPA